VARESVSYHISKKRVAVSILEQRKAWTIAVALLWPPLPWRRSLSKIPFSLRGLDPTLEALFFECALNNWFL